MAVSDDKMREEFEQVFDSALSMCPEQFDGDLTASQCLYIAEKVWHAALTQQPESEPVAGVEAAAQWVEARRDAYIEEHGSYDPDTGVTEYPGDGAEYLEELDDIAEGIRSLRPRRTPQQPESEPVAYRCHNLFGDGKYAYRESLPDSGDEHSAFDWEALCKCGPQPTPQVPERHVHEYVRDTIGLVMRECGNSYSNAWCERLLTIAKRLGVYKGDTVGNIQKLIADWEACLDPAAPSIAPTAPPAGGE